MNKFVVLFLSLLLINASAFAEEVVENTATDEPQIANAEQETNIQVETTENSTNTAEENAVVSTENELPTDNESEEETFKEEHLLVKDSQDILSSLESEKTPEYEVTYKVSSKQYPLPECSDENLLNHAQDYIETFLDETTNKGTLQRRRRYFVLHNLDKFSTEDVANYETSATSPVSEMIADIKINEKIAKQNIRLCKNISKDRYAGSIYLIIYPKDGEYKVHVANLLEKQTPKDQIYFTYQDPKLTTE